MTESPHVKQASGEKDQNTSAYNTPSHDQDPTADGSLSITSNIYNLIKEYDDDDANDPNFMEVDTKRIKKRGCHETDNM